MLSNVCDNNRFLKLTVDLIDDIQRAHAVIWTHGKGMFGLPALDLIQPFGTAIFFHIFVHFGEGIFRICNDRDIYLDVSGNGCGVDIDVHDLRIWGEFVEFSCDTVVETGTNGKQNVTVADCHICCVSAVHTKVSNKKRMVGRDSASSHDSGYDRDICLFYNFKENVIGAGNVDTASCQEKRSFGFAKGLDGTFQLPDMYTGVWLVTANVYAFRIFRTAKFSHDVFRKIDQDRTWTAGTCDVEGFFDNTSKVFTVADGYAIFCDASGDADNINFLKGIVSNEMACYLPGEANKWNTVVIGSRKAGNKVGGSRTACDQADSHFSGSTGVSIGCMDQRLLVAGEDHGNVILFV